MDTSSQQSEVIFHDVWSPLPEPCMLLTLEAIIVEINHAAKMMMKNSHMLIIGEKISDFISTPVDMFLQYLSICSKTGQPVPGSFYFGGYTNHNVGYRCFGHRIKTLVHGHPVIFLRCQSAQLASYKFQALNKQIGATRVAQREIRVERDLLLEVTNRVNAGLCIISRDYTLIWANPVIKKMFGDIIGKKCYKIYSRRDDFCPQCGMHQIFDGSKAKMTTESNQIDKDGNEIVSEIFATAVYDGNGDVSSALELIIPITARKEVEKTREKLILNLQKALSEIHTLRGILPICAFCKNIRNDEGYYEQIEGYIKKHADVDFSHTICPTCMKEHYPEEYDSIMRAKGE